MTRLIHNYRSQDRHGRIKNLTRGDLVFFHPDCARMNTGSSTEDGQQGVNLYYSHFQGFNGRPAVNTRPQRESKSRLASVADQLLQGVAFTLTEASKKVCRSRLIRLVAAEISRQVRKYVPVRFYRVLLFSSFLNGLFAKHHYLRGFQKQGVDQAGSPNHGTRIQKSRGVWPTPPNFHKFFQRKTSRLDILSIFRTRENASFYCVANFLGDKNASCIHLIGRKAA